jgi:hypothetical protein
VILGTSVVVPAAKMAQLSCRAAFGAPADERLPRASWVIDQDLWEAPWSGSGKGASSVFVTSVCVDACKAKTGLLSM